MTLTKHVSCISSKKVYGAVSFHTKGIQVDLVKPIDRKPEGAYARFKGVDIRLVCSLSVVQTTVLRERVGKAVGIGRVNAPRAGMGEEELQKP